MLDQTVLTCCWSVTFLATLLLLAHQGEATYLYISPGNTQVEALNQNNKFALTGDNSLLPELPGRNTNTEFSEFSGVDDIDSHPDTEVTMQPPSIDCGAELDGSTADNGTITSPGYPDNYPAFLNCKWTIKATPGKKILARFSDFDITASTDCTSDYIVIVKDNQPTRYCGKAPPVEIESDNEVLELEFHTNQGDSCKGFKLDYTIVTKQVTCGDKSSDIQFEFRSPNYPAPLKNVTSQCDLTVSHDCETPICQIRLDLLDFRLGPPVAGDCNDDQFIIRANEPLPVLCGNNSQQHLYVDVRGRKETNLNILSKPVLPKPVGVLNESEHNRVIIQWLYEVDPDRAWNILVTQLPCSCSDSPLPDSPAPTGCLQYHTAISGFVSSFNYMGTIRNYEPCWNSTESACGERMHTGHLNNQDYSICIQSQQGYCGVAYQQVDKDSFQLTGLKSENIASPGNGEEECHEDYIFLPKGSHPEDVTGKYPVERFCGQVLGNTLVSPVVSYTKPFLLRMKSDGEEPLGGVALNNRGFKLKYSQIPCSVERSNALSFT